MPGSVRHVDVAGAVDGNPVRCAQLSVADSFNSHRAEKGAARSEFLDSTVVGVGYQNASGGINSNSRRAVKLTCIAPSTAVNHVTDTLGQGTEAPGRCIRRLVDGQ